jgi:hypothetical protein
MAAYACPLPFSSQEALEALKRISRHDFGHDKEKWNSWWERENKGISP